VDLDHNGIIDARKGEHAYPYSYAGGAKMQVRAVFAAPNPNLDAAIKDGKLQFRASAANHGIPLNMNFPATTTTDLLSSRQVVVTLRADSALEQATNRFDPLDLTWQYSVDKGKTWWLAGISHNVIYVTLKQPRTSKMYLTAVGYGSYQHAEKKDPLEVMKSIWIDFNTQRAANWMGTAMTYYKNWNTPSITVPKLLSTKDGQCTAWADLFLEALKSQGIDGDLGAVYKNIGPANANEAFLVNDWQFVMANNKANNKNVYPYLNGAKENYLVAGSAKDNEFKFDPEGVKDLPGVKGQNTENPRSIFNNHAIVKLTAKGAAMYFDPSYGLTYSSLDDLTAKAIAGFFTMSPVPGAFAYYIRKTPQAPKNQLVERG
jgi:hypothetical protein